MGDEKISTISKSFRTPSVVVTDDLKQSNGLQSPSPAPAASNPAQALLLQPVINNVGGTSNQGHSSYPCGDQQPDGLPVVDPPRRRRCCNKRLRKLVLGLVVTAAVATSWVGATHFIKRSFLYRESTGFNLSATPYSKATAQVGATPCTLQEDGEEEEESEQDALYNAPFFTTWFCTLWTGVFFPLFMLVSVIFRSEKATVKSIYRDSVRMFREKGFTVAKFFTRIGFFTALWVATNYMYVHALRVLDATDVMALYSSNVSFFYLLSWVVLHEQFVGVRIVAVILCNTGIALLAYMDGLTRTPTLAGVIVAATSSAGSAVYKCTFKKVVGEASFGQVALFFTLISAFNTLLLWPIAVALFFSGAEIIHWRTIPWWDLTGAAGFTLVSNLLGNFGVAVTYEIFITLGLIVAVPLSAAWDTHQYKVKFEGMKLAGIILISIGFMLVLFPDNWPDYVTRLLRMRWRRTHHTPEEPSRAEMSSGGARSTGRLRSPSGLVR